MVGRQRYLPHLITVLKLTKNACVCDYETRKLKLISVQINHCNSITDEKYYMNSIFLIFIF